ncbi:MAG: AraC family ligand binding domain-containing protein [Oscillospiraceae bacterium]
MEIASLNQADPQFLYLHRIDAANALAPGESYERRFTQHYEIDLITGGQGTVETQGVFRATAPGMLFFRKPGMQVCGGGGYHCYHLGFSLPQGQEISFPPVIQLQAPGAVQAQLAQLYQAFLEHSQVLELVSKKCILEILFLLYQEHLRRRASGISPRGPARGRCWRRQADPGTSGAALFLEQLARQANVSKYHFCRVFKALVGNPPGLRGCLSGAAGAADALEPP